MVSIERIVRPFAEADVGPGPRSLSHIPTTAPPGVFIHIGKAGGKTFSYEFSFSSSFAETEDNKKEIRRVEETVRVPIVSSTSSTPDPANFAEVNRIKELDVADESTLKRTRYKFKNPAV